MTRMKVWSLSGYVYGAVSIVIYQLREQKTNLVAVVASKSNTLYAIRMAKLAWLGAGILTAMTTLFITERSL